MLNGSLIQKTLTFHTTKLKSGTGVAYPSVAPELRVLIGVRVIPALVFVSLDEFCTQMFAVRSKLSAIDLTVILN